MPCIMAPAERLIDVSAMGTTFILPESLLAKHGWILSRLPQEEDVDDIQMIPWGQYHNGRFYILVEPSLFKHILHFAQFLKLPAAMELAELQSVRKCCGLSLLPEVSGLRR